MNALFNYFETHLGLVHDTSIQHLFIRHRLITKYQQ